MTAKPTEGKQKSTQAPADYGVVLEPGTVRLERVLPGPIERVWAYLTESEKRGKWLATGEMEPRVGGVAELTIRHSTLSTKQAPIPARFKKFEKGATSQHTITRFEPPRLLSLTWGGGIDGMSEVTFELSARGDEVLLVVTHRRLADRQTAVDVCAGWHSHLAILLDRLNGREPEAFWTLWERLKSEYEKRVPSAKS
jgi:uncharacterized protein YndB with AHSA1/START domain